MGELLRRFRYPLTYLLLLAICVVSIASRRGGAEFGPGSRLVLRVAVPLQEMVTLPVREMERVWRDYVDLVGVQEENRWLREQVVRLEEENLQYREAIVSSERFQRLAGFRAQHDVPMVPANVVAHDLSPWFQSVIIDQGAAAGIRPGMPVITDLGVVGVVAGTAPGASKVLLMIDPQSRIDVYAERSRARGSVHGASGRECALEYVRRDDDLAAGDLLLTSGLGGVYPKGLVVGRVAGVERQPYGLFQEATVEPAVDFRRLEEVFVILEQRKVPDASEFDAEDPGLWPAAPAPPAGAGESR